MRILSKKLVDLVRPIEVSFLYQHFPPDPIKENENTSEWVNKKDIIVTDSDGKKEMWRRNDDGFRRIRVDLSGVARRGGIEP